MVISPDSNGFLDVIMLYANQVHVYSDREHAYALCFHMFCGTFDVKDDTYVLYSTILHFGYIWQTVVFISKMVPKTFSPLTPIPSLF